MTTANESRAYRDRYGSNHMSKLLSLLLCLLATRALAQVEVGIRTKKTSYLAGETVAGSLDDLPINQDAGRLREG